MEASSPKANNKKLDKMVDDSTHTMNLISLHTWLMETGFKPLTGRVFHGMLGRETSVSYPDLVEAKYENLVHLGSYNYSGLNCNEKVLDAALNALQKYGTTTSGVRLLNGTSDIHIELETRLAGFLGTEDAVTYSSGYIANISVLKALISDQDVAFSDQLNHQSIVDGLELSKCRIVRYRHRDVDQLASLLAHEGIAKRKFIVTDGVFSMDGDTTPLDTIAELAKKYNAYVLVDDAHATAAIGPCGRGTAAHFGLKNGDVSIITGSLSKGLPGIGGFAAGSKRTMDLLRYGSNGYVFSASLPPPVVAGLIAAIDVLEKNPEIQDHLHSNELLLRNGISNIGLDIGHSDSPVIPVMMPDRTTAFEFARAAHNLGIYVNPVCFPAVSRTRPRIRINASASLTKEDINLALKVFETVARDLGLLQKVIQQ